MYKMTKLIYNALKETDSDLKMFTDEDEAHSEVWLQYGIKNGGNYRIRFISTDDDNDVRVRVFGIVHLEKEQIIKVLPAINMLNSKYRFVNFYCDDDGDVNLQYDFLVKSVHPEEACFELMVRIVKIIDDSYPVLMHSIWS